MSDVPTLPGSGLVTFLFTDIEGSTRLAQDLGDDRWSAVLAAHRRVILDALAAAQPAGALWGPVGSEGDSLFVVFNSPLGAARGAAAAQRALTRNPWPDGAEVRVRMGLHAGEALRTGNDYVGFEVHKAARVASAGHGGQIVLSRTMRDLVLAARPSDLQTRNLGAHRLKDVPEPEELFQLEADGLGTDFPPLRTLDARPNNLPLQVTTFIGREDEITEARRRLSGTHLLTLTGPGGTGKTRLALRLAEEVVHEFRDGVWFVPLASIGDAGLVPSAIAAALRIAEVPGTPALDRLRDVLADRQQLVVLDNFEQILAAAPAVGELLRAAPGLTVVVTSRALLHLSGERELAVPPLRRPDPKHLPSLAALSQYEAVALFIERAEAVRPGFAVTNENAPAVAEICSRLDGLPLAIELAAARIRVLSPQAILTRLGSTLDLLSGGARDLPERQQTLRAAIAWSYDLLEAPDRRLLSRLSVFVGGCLLEEAEAVCGPTAELGREVFDGLGALLDQSLVQRRDEPDGESRFGMLETIREFGLEQLGAGGEAEVMRQRHAHVFLALALDAEPHLTGKEAKQWLDRLERSMPNLRAALTWCLEQGAAETGLRLGAALWRYWQMRGTLDEGRDWLASLTALPHAVDHPAALALAHEAAGGVAYWRGDMAAAQTSYEAALAIQRTLDDPAGLADALYNLSFVFVVPRTDMARGEALLLEALALYEQVGDETGIANVHFSLTNVAQHRREWAASREHLAVAMPILRRLGNQFMVGWGLHLDAIGRIQTGDLGEARGCLVEATQVFAAARDVSGIALLLDDWAELALAEGDVLRSTRLAGAGAAFQASSGADLGTIINRTQGRPGRDERTYDAAEVEAAWQEGQAMSLDEAVAYAMSQADDG